MSSASSSSKRVRSSARSRSAEATRRPRAASFAETVSRLGKTSVLPASKNRWVIIRVALGNRQQAIDGQPTKGFWPCPLPRSRLDLRQLVGKLGGGVDRLELHHERRVELGVQDVLHLPARRQRAALAHLLQRLQQVLGARVVEGPLQADRLVDRLLALLVVVEQGAHPVDAPLGDPVDEM